MRRLENWHDWNGRRPLLATVICAFLIVISIRVLLRTFHILPPLPGGPVDHPQLQYLLSIVESSLQFLGAIFLWQMRPFAATLFATEAILATLSGIYLALINPGEHMLALRATHPKTVFVSIALATAFHFALALYAWRIATRQRSVSPAPA